MSDAPLAAGPTIAIARLPAGSVVPFAYVPDAAARARLAARLGLLGLKKARLEGQLRPAGGQDWQLDAALGATAVQACVVTLAPVTTRVDVPVERRYTAQLPEDLPGEMEMPEDDSLEPLPDMIDLEAVLTEALALALPDYPRAEGAELGSEVFAPPGQAPLTDAEARPFAVLKALRAAARAPDDPEDEGA